MKKLFAIVLTLGVVFATLVYLVYFDRFSETELVNLSIAWSIPVVFGASGLLSAGLTRSPLVAALICSGLWCVLLFALFNLVFRRL